MDLPKVGIVIINYNGKAFIPHCLSRLTDLQYPNLEIVFMDNNSTDGSVEIVKDQFPTLRIHQTGCNNGYSGAAEIAVNLARKERWDYLMLMGTDIIFEPDYITQLINKLESEPKAGCAVGKLYKYEFFLQQKTNVLDSCGLKAYRDRRIVDRGQAETDNGQYDITEEVFGATGAAPMYRVEALANIEVYGEVFDQDFFMYKEDVDVSWRLRLLGWQIWYVPTAIAHHGRGTGIFKRTSYLQIGKERRNLSKFQKTHSFRNHKWMVFKNDFWRLKARDLLPIIKRKLLFGLFILIFEPYQLKELFKYWKRLGKMRTKRRLLMKRIQVQPQYMSQWFN